METTLSFAQALRRLDMPPEELFGTDPRGSYRAFAKVLHPDASDNPGAPEAFKRLVRAWDSWSKAQLPTTITSKHTFEDVTLATRGHLANIFLATHHLDPVVLKVARSVGTDDLLAQEARALKMLESTGRLTPYFPKLVEAFRLPSGRVNALERVPGVTLAHVRSVRPGLDMRDAAWMWRRLLVALGAAHRAGLVHGAVLPEHVMVIGAEHGLVLLDWCYSAPLGSKVPAMVSSHRAMYPPEVLAGQPASQSSDIFMAAKLFSLMVPCLPKPVEGFVRACTLTKPTARPLDAFELLRDFDDLLERMYGPRTFRPFTL